MKYAMIKVEGKYLRISTDEAESFVSGRVPEAIFNLKHDTWC